MARGRLPSRTHQFGSGPKMGMPSRGTHRKIVGYGIKGNPFRSPKAYNASKSGQRHAANPKLSTKPVATGRRGNVFFSPAKAKAAIKMRRARRK